MEKSSVFINSRSIIRHIDESQLNLTGLPSFPTSVNLGAHAPKYAGYVSYYESARDFAFLLTNGCRIDKGNAHTNLKEIFFKPSDNDNKIKQGDIVVFDIVKQSDNREKAVSVRLLEITQEDFGIVSSYEGDYSMILGNNRHETVKTNFRSKWLDYYLSSEKGQQMLLPKAINDLDSYLLEKVKECISEDEYKRRLGESICRTLKTDFNKAKLFADSLPEEQFRELLAVNMDNPNPELRIYLTNRTKDLSWVKHPSVISLWNKQITNDNIGLEQIWNGYDKGQKDELAEYVSNSSIAKDELLISVILITGRFGIYGKIKDKGKTVKWYSTKSAICCSQLLSFASNELESDDLQEFVNWLGDDSVVSGLNLMSDEEKYQFLLLLPDDYAIDLVYKHYRNTELFESFIGEKWESCKTDVPYVIFDLESDGDNIKEFSFLSEDNVRTYQGEEQINSLKRIINKKPIVVGHNIRQWDLGILRKKGITTNSFVWDTLEIEFLLDPCRYAYSLHTSHNSADDVKLENELFWNQLYRLSEQPERCKELKNFLPKEINDILDRLTQPVFTEYFKRTSNHDKQFFQELRPLAESLLNNLKKIAGTPKDESVLIISPRDLWPRIAQVIPLQFPTENEDFKIIDRSLLAEKPLFNPLWNAILKRFCESSATPVVENLALYLRSGGQEGKIYFSDELIAPYLCKPESHIDCIDINSFEDEDLWANNYKHIYLIGTERQERVHKVKYEKEWTIAELLERGSRLPLTMASTNISLVYSKQNPIDAKAKEAERLGLKKSDLTANIWAERTSRGTIAFYQNYQYQKYSRKFLAHFNSIKPVIIPWSLEELKNGEKSIVQIRTKKNRNFDATVHRVNPSSTSRAYYWVYQMAMVSNVHKDNPGIPIIYIINDLSEQDQLVSYARSLGYFIPDEGTSFRKLEYIGSRSNGLIIISKKQFLSDIGFYRTDKAFCYVWDNMEIDRYMMMWDTLPFEDDYRADEESDKDETTRGTTPRQCIFAAWPIFEHYYSLVLANNKDTRFYILDPHFDDYTGLSKECHANAKAYGLWADEGEYNKDLEKAETFFSNLHNVLEQINTEEAMEVIRPKFIGEKNHWREEQIPLLKYMIERRGDCLISLPTGGGKSVIFQGPAILRASISHRLTLVVSPLRALMQDQVEELHAKGFVTNVDYLSGDRMLPETREVYRRISSGDIALLYITPERFRVKSFINVLYQRLRIDGGLEYIVFDEAHCISQWGQDFRPDYRNALTYCVEEIQSHFDVRIAMFSATVTSQVESDIRRFVPDITKLGEAAAPVRDHISISFQERGREDAERIKAIADYIIRNNIDFDKSCMLVFCRTRRQCADTAEELNQYCIEHAEEIDVLAKCVEHIDFFHAGLDAATRNDKYKQFKNDPNDHIPEDERIMILCTTKAFGMGMDIPNVHYVIHFSPPSVLEDYLQEVGRAGRDLELYRNVLGDQKIPALCLTNEEDFRTLKDLLVRSQMSWSDLTECKNAIVSYILQFKPSLEYTRLHPIVVPFNVWVKNLEEFNEVTASRLAFSWLEHIGYIRLKYLGLASISITLPMEQRNTAYLEVNDRRMLDFLYKHAERKDEPTQFSIDGVKNGMFPYVKGLNGIINSILRLHHDDFLSLNQEMRCELKPRRYGETYYMIEEDDDRNALHIAFNGLKSLLSDCRQGVEGQIGIKEREEICKHLLDAFDNDGIDSEIKKKRNGNVEVIQYMPWKRYMEAKNLQLPKGAVTKAETFKKDIAHRVGYNMFRILQFLPDVDFKRLQTEEDLIYRIEIKSDKWKDAIPQLEEDCFNWLKYIYKGPNTMNWAEAIVDSEISEADDYDYFVKILDVLSILQYIEHSPLLPSGVEVLTNDKTGTDIDEGVNDNSPMHEYRADFDEQERTKKIRLSCMDIFTLIDKSRQKEFVDRYFNCRNYNDYLVLAGDFVPDGSDIMSAITDEALKKEEAKLEGNNEQQVIYNRPPFENINVLAGPGSGKTHMLTLRCAKLIYKEHVDPQSLLVLAYNRAVVVELRNRLDRLFSSLGMSKMAHRLNVYTFHALAKKCMGRVLDNIKPEEWEGKFLNFIRSDRQNFKAVFPTISHVLVDEFQDITQTRLDALLEIHTIYPNAKFFTIGDINQSIYGFDKVPRDHRVQLTPEQYAQYLDPIPYYDRLARELVPVQLTMFTNYRSYQKILDAASAFLPDNRYLPHSAESLMRHEPQNQYVEFDDSSHEWVQDLVEYVNKAMAVNQSITSSEEEYKRVSTIAVFFRKNNEVYRGFAKLRGMLPNGVRIRIQGTNLCEMWRGREFYSLIDCLRRHPSIDIILDENNEHCTTKGIKAFLTKEMEKHPNWDQYSLDLVFTLVLDYCESIRNDSKTYTWGDMADYIIDVAGNDDGGQVYKIYDRYKNERILKENSISVILTTMHKVKGLEFDAVFITSSDASLPLKPHRDNYEPGQELLEDDLADIDEERRLMFVAYTRAKKYLHVYKGNRERALDERSVYKPSEDENVIYTEREPGLRRYFLSALASAGGYGINDYIKENVKKEDEVSIVRRRHNGKYNYYIYHDNHPIGRLSGASSIVRTASAKNVAVLTGFSVSEICVWTYEDSLRTDQANDTNYSANWCQDAIRQGYIYIVQISGFGEPINN